MGKFDLNRDASGREHFLIGKEQVADSKISGYVWPGPKSTKTKHGNQRGLRGGNLRQEYVQK